jgi:hypothetical protein
MSGRLAAAWLLPAATDTARPIVMQNAAIALRLPPDHFFPAEDVGQKSSFDWRFSFSAIVCRPIPALHIARSGNLTTDDRRPLLWTQKLGQCPLATNTSDTLKLHVSSSG